MAVSPHSSVWRRPHTRWSFRSAVTRVVPALLLAALAGLAFSARRLQVALPAAHAAPGVRRSGDVAARGRTPSLLLYVPLFTATGGGADGEHGLRSFVTSLTSQPLWASAPLLPTDVLLVVTSAEAEARPSVGEFALLGAFRAVSPTSHVFIHRMTEQTGGRSGDVHRYDRSRSSAGWTNGPNTVFYSVMAAGGPVYEQHTRHYSHVLQLETDCVVLRPGWLSYLATPALGDTVSRPRHGHRPPRFLLSGALLGPRQCVYDDVARTCGDVAAQPDYVQRHINGNALYALSPQLQLLFNHSQADYPTWPFDLATWLSARDLGLTHLMLASPHVVNIAHRVDHAALASPAQLVRGTRVLPDKLVLAHVPLRMRMSGLEAVLAQLQCSVPVTVTFVSASHLEYASQWVRSTAEAGITNVLVVAFDRTTAEAVRGMAPADYAVLLNTTASHGGSTSFKSGDFLNLVNARHAVIVDLLAAGLSVFAVDVDCHVTRSYTAHLASLPADRVYFASDAPAGWGYHHYGERAARYFLNAGLFFVPQAAASPALALFTALRAHLAATGRADQDVLNDMVSCTALASCVYTATATKIGLLHPVLFPNGANYFAKQWPSPAALAGALVVHNNWADGLAAKRFRAQGAGLWAQQKQHLPPCASVCALTRNVSLGGDAGESTASGLATYLGFFAFVKQQACDCAVIPGFSAPGIRTLPFDVLFDHAAVANFTGADLYPSLAHLQAGAAPLNWSTGAQQLPDALPAGDLLLAQALMTTFRWLDHSVGSPRTCVDDMERTTEQVAVAALQPSSLASVLAAAKKAKGAAHPRVFLAGAWRVLHDLVDNEAPEVAVSASRRFFPPHERAAFGLGFVRGRTGDDPLFDVLDLLLCRASQSRVALEGGPTAAGSREQLLRAVAAHIPPPVLAEDLAVLAAMPPGALRHALSGRLVFSLEPVANNGLSNVIGAAQTLAFLSTTTALSPGPGASSDRAVAFIMPPFQGQHLRRGSGPWGTVINATALYAAFPHALPPSTLPLLHPRAVLDALLGGSQVACCEGSGVPGAGAVVDRFPGVFAALVAASMGRTYTRLFVSHAHGEALLLGGHTAARPAHPYLGCTDGELHGAVAHVDPVSDVALPSVFRAYAFTLADSRHVRFGAQWRAAFVANEAMEAKAAGIVAALPRPYACIHLRLKQEYLAAHGGEVHGNSTAVLAALASFLAAQRARKVTTFYAATDTHAAALLAPLVPQGAALHTCQDFGCSAQGAGDDSARGFVDRSVCAAADVFAGNIYSSYTLHICALRGDQACVDLFGRRISDGRLLV